MHWKGAEINFVFVAALNVISNNVEKKGYGLLGKNISSASK